MIRCGHCGADLSEPALFCPSCGARQSSPSRLPTEVATPERPGPAPATPSAPIGRLDSSASGVLATFTPGQVLARRYRIIGLIGRGGMGEVYRADDLKLGQAVSLKFLPRPLAETPALLDRFHAEVRNARQVSHPNVCRVYDIGEIDGHHFLSMEFVDGEDLATLLRRIGRLPPGKANEVARQMCAGLAAAHEKGVLHRDLKPSNVMLDGHGRVRITDFGLAVRTEEGGRGDLAGTPAYMAPEQFEGKPITERSDIYSLGLILYEVYTGKHAFEAASAAEWRSRHTRSEPTPPTTVEGGIDPAVERAILRCLEKDPSRRPGSALQLAAALPGGDPLAAALAAGETPSPEMVAAAGGQGAIAPRHAIALLLGTLLAVAALFTISPYSTDLGLATLTKGPEVLRERSRQVLARFGFAEALDTESWFSRDYFPMRYMADRDPSTRWRRELKGWPAPVLFTYRQSPRWLAAPFGDVGPDEPSHEVSRMAAVTLDANGALRMLRAMPPQRDTTRGPWPAADWAALFDEARLPMASFRPVEPQWLSPSPFDARAEWTGPAPWAPRNPLRVAAAAYRGQPVYFEVLGPWSRPWRMEQQAPTLSRKIARGTITFGILLGAAIAIAIARRNLRLGRGDRRGALRLAGFYLVVAMLGWFGRAHHVPDLPQEFSMIFNAAGLALLGSGLVGLFYLAWEPHVRRRMPELLIGWTRLLDGRFRDPRLGRDVLIGALVGCIAAFSLHVVNALPTWIPFPGQTTVFPNYQVLAGGGRVWAELLRTLTESFGPATWIFGVLFLLRLGLRPGAAMVGLMAIVSITSLGGENVLLETPGAVLMGVLVGFTVARYGLLPVVTIFVFYGVLASLPLPLAPPYAASSAIVLVILLALLVYAFRISIGPRPLLAVALDE